MFFASLLAFFTFIFLLATVTVAIAWIAFLKRQAEETEAGNAAEEETDGIEQSSPLLRSDRLSTLTFWDSLLEKLDIGEILRARLAEAELDWSVGRVTLTMLLGSTVAFLLCWKFLPLWAALVAAVAVAFAPYAYILRMRARRFDRFREGFPDVLDSLARALRAGYPLSAAMDTVVAESSPTVAAEIRRTSAEANLGMGWSRALENMGRRMPILEVNLFAAAVQLHSRTGGKLGEVMSTLAENMRESLSLRGEVRALAAHGKLTGAILTVLPVVIALMMMIVSPDYMMILYNHPWGKNLIAIAIGCLVLAHLVIRKIVNIQV